LQRDLCCNSAKEFRPGLQWGFTVTPTPLLVSRLVGEAT
jgi:hypothetical protein